MEEITNDKMAMDAIREVCKYLAKSEFKTDAPVSRLQERKSADIARRFCRKLLESSKSVSYEYTII